MRLVCFVIESLPIEACVQCFTVSGYTWLEWGLFSVSLVIICLLGFLQPSLTMPDLEGCQIDVTMSVFDLAWG